MKIATFNINNVNKRLANLTAWLRTAGPDVVCLQELNPTCAESTPGDNQINALAEKSALHFW